MPFPTITVWDDGVAVREKSGAGFTIRVTVALWIKLPLVPVMVRVFVPVAAPVVVVMLRVELPEPITEVGVNVALAPAGSPLTVKPTLPLNPLRELMVAV